MAVALPKDHRSSGAPSEPRSPPPGKGGLAVGGSAKQLSCLAAQLAEVGPVGKLGHDVSSPPGLAFGRDAKTILPESTTLSKVVKVDSGPAREPGGALLRRCRQPTRRPRLV